MDIPFLIKVVVFIVINAYLWSNYSNILKATISRGKASTKENALAGLLIIGALIGFYVICHILTLGFGALDEDKSNIYNTTGYVDLIIFLSIFVFVFVMYLLYNSSVNKKQTAAYNKALNDVSSVLTRIKIEDYEAVIYQLKKSDTDIYQ